MRIQLKIYLDEDKDIDCSGKKPDYWLTFGSFGELMEDLDSAEQNALAELASREGKVDN